jgi:serine phosphatase RsbU (regulator of sigma subunit)
MIRALIVDDEAPARDRLRHLLAGSGVEVVAEAADGDEAIERIDRLAPDVVFLDIQMPGLSGLDVIARLTPPKPRVVFCTAFDRFAIDAFEHHAVDYLLKPVNRERLLRTIERIASEVRQHRRLQRERDEAVRAQAKLMPADTATAGLECAALCVPAEGVGGDYYDVLPAGEGRMGLAVGDVSGKGMYAGILAAAIQARMQAITAPGCGDAAAAMAELNRLTIGGLDDNRFATVFFGIHDRATSTLEFVNAGHPPALILSPDGTCRLLESTSPAIGWPNGTFVARRERAASGDVIALYSDGMTETTSPDGSDLSVNGFTEILRRHAGLPASALVSASLADVRRFAGGAPAEDDRTLLVARVL